MDYAEFQARWEANAQEEFEAHLRRPVTELLRDARDGRHGSYYALWRAIAARASLHDAAPVLLDILRAHRLYWPGERPDHDTYAIRTNRSQEEFLARTHCARALLDLLGRGDRDEAVEFAAEKPGRQERVERLARMVDDVLHGHGPDPS